MNPAESLSVTAENLAVLDREQTALQERRNAHIREMANALSAEMNTMPEPFFLSDFFRRRYHETLTLPETASSGAIEKNREEVKQLFISLTNLERISLCRLLMAMLDEKPPVSGFFVQDEEAQLPNRIAYVRNYYADTAYQIFSEALASPTVTYCDDFVGVCEDVYYSRAGLALLPIENSNEGRLVSFRNLINKYDLKIVLTCQVAASDNGAYTKFALLKKNVERMELKKGSGAGCYFEFSITLNADAALCDILQAAECYGMRLYKIDSMPISYTDREYAYDLIFDAESGDLQSFLCYLHLEAPQFTPVGIYSHMEERS